MQYGQIEIASADLTAHQLVQQGFEQLFEHGALLPMQGDLAIDGVETSPSYRASAALA